MIALVASLLLSIPELCVLYIEGMRTSRSWITFLQNAFTHQMLTGLQPCFFFVTDFSVCFCHFQTHVTFVLSLL